MEKQIIANSQLIGEYRTFKICRFCLSDKIEIAIDLGNIPLAGGFLKKGTKQSEFAEEKVYPLQIAFCKNCFFLQVASSVNPDILFKNYFYFSSTIKTLVEHFDKNILCLFHMSMECTRLFSCMFYFIETFYSLKGKVIKK